MKPITILFLLSSFLVSQSDVLSIKNIKLKSGSILIDLTNMDPEEKKDVIKNCYDTINDGIYIYHYNKNEDFKKNWYIRTQVKFNDGLVQKDKKDNYKTKPGSLYSSWNCVIKFEKVNDLIKIY